jgi:predicted ATPase
MLIELRSVTDLARLWADQENITKATNILTPVFDAFPKCVDTPDLQQALHLLTRLSSR